MNIVDIDYNDPLHVKCIRVLSKINKFHDVELNIYLNLIYNNDSNYKGLFICEGKKPLGYLLYFMRYNNEHIDLLYLLINKNKRNNGYGSILVKHLQKTYNEATLIVRIDNNLLEKWYNKHNFYILKDALHKCIEPKNKGFILEDSEINKSVETRMYYLEKW